MDFLTDLVTNAPSTQTLTIALATGVLVISASRYVWGKFRRDHDLKLKKYYLQYLFKGTHMKIKAAKQSASKLTKEHIKPLIALKTSPNNSPSTVRELKYAMELIQQHLESLDNIKPNSLLIEYTSRYPLDDDPADSPTHGDEFHDQLLARICASFAAADRDEILDQFHQLKSTKKALVRHALDCMNDLDKVMEFIDSI